MSDSIYRENGSLLPRKKDNQQWILNYMIKTTGRTHMFEVDGRFVPEGVACLEQIPVAGYKKAIAMEKLARLAEKNGDYITARDIYHAAAAIYHTAQHNIFTDKNPDKVYIHQRVTACYDRICAINNYPLERVEIPFEDTTIQGLFHILPGHPKAPTLIAFPGMDMCKETFIDPGRNYFMERGFNVLVIDGPGQGMSNIRGLKIKGDNYERAASACIDWLLQRPEVDPERLGSIGFSFGTYMNLRVFALDKRLKAASGLAGCFATKARPMAVSFEPQGLRTKQVIMYMYGMEDDEVGFDKMAMDMHHEDIIEMVDRPFLLQTGEFDPVTPLSDLEYLFDKIPGPKEMWVLEGSYHCGVRECIPNLGNVPPVLYIADWLRKTLNEGLEEGHCVKRYIASTPGNGPYGHLVDDFKMPTRLPDDVEPKD